MSYIDYIYQDGDIVYCDIPYEDTQKYDEGFNHKEFYDWAYNADFPIWFSSYKISDSRFNLIYAKQKITTLSATSNNTKNFECLYANNKAVLLTSEVR